MTAQSVAARTKLSLRTINTIEDGRFDDLPPGIYARAYVRTYAEAVGIDPAVVQPLIDSIPTNDVDMEAIAKCREAWVCRRGPTRTAAAVDAGIVTLLSACGVLVCVALTGPEVWDVAAITIAFLALAVPTLILYFGLLGATGVGTAGAWLFRVDFVPGVCGPLDGALLARRTYEYFRSEVIALLASSVVPRPLDSTASLPLDGVQ